MKSVYWIKKVQLRRSPGFEVGEFPPIDNLKNGLNVIWGPNGVGKSTLARAMRGLIWKTKDVKEVDAESLLETPDGSWRLELSQGEPKQTRLVDNQTIQLPGRVDELSDSYWFPLHELLQVEEKGGTFLKRVQTAMQGGVDLSLACTESGGKNQFITSNCAPHQSVVYAKNEVKNEQSRQAESRDIQTRIEELNKTLKQNESLLDRQKTLVKAIEIYDLQTTEKELLDRLSKFPEIIANLQTDSPERLKQLRADVLKKKQELLQAQDALQTLHITLEECKVPDSFVEDLAFEETLRGLQIALSKAKENLLQRERELLEADSALDSWNTQHAWLLPQPPPESTLSEKLLLLRHLANDCEPLRCAVEADRYVVRDLGPLETESKDEPILDPLLVRLEDWIHAYILANSAPKGVLVPKNFRKKLLGLVSFALLVIALLAILVHPYSIFVSFLALALLWKLVPGPADPDQNKDVQDNLAKTQELVENLLKQLPNHQKPDEWTPAACVELQHNLVLEKQVIASTRLANQKRDTARETLRKSQEALLKWAENWQTACEDLGIDRENPVLSGAQFYNFSTQLNSWTELQKKQNMAKNLLEESRQQYQIALESLQKTISTQETNPIKLTAMINNLVDRIHLARNYRIQIKENELRVQTNQENHDQSLEKLQAFWNKCGIEFDDVFTLEKVASQVEAWIQTRREYTGVQADKDKIAMEFPLSAQLAMTNSRAWFDSESADIEDKLEKLGAVREELGRFKQTYDQLLAGDSLAKALKRQQEALTDLERLRKKEVIARVTQLLTDRLAAETERECQPEVLLNASTWLARITHARYTLSANDSGFFAHDTVQGRNRSLDQLSSGTRVQVLFAVRMAFIERQELTSGVSLPIFLDELLANSDDERALAIVSAILEIATERQVFYITAQQDEVEKLRQLSGGTLNEIPLERLVKGYGAEKHPIPQFSYTPQPIPKPTADYHAYAELCQVSGADLWNPIGKHHAWHLFMESEQLHTCLIRSFSTIAQVVKAMSERIPGIAERSKMLQHAQLRAQDGRCKPLCVEHLADRSLNINRSAGFWKQTLEYVVTHQLTGNQLLQAIENKEISRYNDSSKNALRDWLLTQGFASETEPLSYPEILTQIHTAYPDLMMDSEDSLVVMRWLAAVLGYREGLGNQQAP